MLLRKNHQRNRNLKKDVSLWNPIFLQQYFAIKTVKDYFQSLPEDKLTIYDFGCGSKPYEVFCKNKNYIGIDIDTENIQADIFSDASEVPVENCVADIVVSFYMLEHVENPQKVINEKYRILKKGGELFMLIPLYWEEHEQPYDFFRFTRFAIEMMLKNAGFEQITIKEINSTPSITGMHLARFFTGKFTRFLVPIINYFF